METLQIKQTPTSLAVVLDASTGTLSFSGRSVSENSAEFFKPIMDWLAKYAEQPFEKTKCIFEFEYFNSAARKSLVEIFKILQVMHRNGNPLLVEWHYDAGDESMKEMGDEYSNLFSLKFRFVQD